VDPGVGTARRRLVVRTERHTFVLPDNGLVSRILDREPRSRRLGARGRALPARTPSPPRSRDGTSSLPRRPGSPAAWPRIGSVPRSVTPSACPPRSPLPGREPRPVVWVDRFGNVVLDVTRVGASHGCGRARAHAAGELHGLAPHLRRRGAPVRRCSCSAPRDTWRSRSRGTCRPIGARPLRRGPRLASAITPFFLRGSRGRGGPGGGGAHAHRQVRRHARPLLRGGAGHGRRARGAAPRRPFSRPGGRDRPGAGPPGREAAPTRPADRDRLRDPRGEAGLHDQPGLPVRHAGDPRRAALDPSWARRRWCSPSAPRP
jgi:hypothetical protein